MATACRACSQPLQWEQQWGIRVFTMRGKVAVYRVRCGCGEREVTADGKPAKAGA